MRHGHACKFPVKTFLIPAGHTAQGEITVTEYHLRVVSKIEDEEEAERREMFSEEIHEVDPKKALMAALIVQYYMSFLGKESLSYALAIADSELPCSSSLEKRAQELLNCHLTATEVLTAVRHMVRNVDESNMEDFVASLPVTL